MTYETYVLILCGIVYVALTTLAIATITALTKMTLGLIRHGAQDKDIIKEYIKSQKEGDKQKGKTFDIVVSIFLCIAFAIVFSFSLYVNINQDKYFEHVPTLKVVQSGSMSTKHEKNEYLTENGLNNQFDTFDLILVYKAPAEEDLKLYDIVVYEMEHEGEVGYVVHRIVGIDEANEKHGRLFKTQGDAVESADRKKVEYSQIKGIYRNQRVPFIGSFVMFMQSPAGWMCMILMLAATIATPIVDKKLEKARRERYQALCKQKQSEALRAQSQPIVAAPICLYPVYYDPTKVSFPLQPTIGAPIPFCPINQPKQVSKSTQSPMQRRKRGNKR